MATICTGWGGVSACWSYPWEHWSDVQSLCSVSTAKLSSYFTQVQHSLSVLYSQVLLNLLYYYAIPSQNYYKHYRNHLWIYLLQMYLNTYWKSWLSPHLNSLHNHTHPHVFWLRKGITGAVEMHYKHYMTHHGNQQVLDLHSLFQMDFHSWSHPV